MHGHVHHLGEKKLIGFWLLGSFIGAIFIANSYILKYALKQGDSVAGICAFIGALILGLPVVIRAIKDLVRGELHMNELAAIAVLACFARGDYTTAGVVSFLVLVGDIIEHRTAIGVHESIETLLKLVPQKARLIEDGREREIEASSLKPGQTIRIRPGENVPADGTIEEGTSALNEATITGESLPADKGVGQAVFAGTLNLTGAIKVKVTKIGEDTTLGRVRHLIKDAEATRIPIMTVIDRYMSWY
ncbi:cation-translocating P-type ATPase, partial [bacterium]|nr:cation-translocating P-type ATPase [bacterium]